jgi:hypothetical protein
MNHAHRRASTPLALALLTLAGPLAGCNRGGDPAFPENNLGRCIYVNRFSKAEECREYRGDDWTEDAARADCSEWTGELEVGALCEYDSILGACILEGGTEKVIRVVNPGADPSDCRSTERGCELFGGGVFLASAVCGGEDLDDIEDDAVVFQPPVLECRDPLEGEPAGASEGGKVCTWSMISACTEPGRRFQDYATCDTVLTQRPYFPVPSAPPPAEPDTRIEDDPAYAAELAWVTEQAEACACACCHTSSITPMGASVWDTEAAGNWINTFSPYGLAFAGGFLDSSLLGAYPASDNNGFDRDITGMPTTDPDRLMEFFRKELIHRGFSPEDFADANPTPEIFHQQDIYEPGPCAEGEGVAADGAVTWSGGNIRYLYILAEGSRNPGTPPNLDLPVGTLWRIDVPPDQSALRSGQVRYGQLPDNTSQRFPAGGSAAPLISGTKYYIYALADVAVPITRCIFTAP